MSVKGIDLFCGAGGFSKGIGEAGINVLFGADKWPVAAQAYEQYVGHDAINANLAQTNADQLFQGTDINPDEVDLVVGGPPCQGFSIQRTGEDEDERNHLVLEFGRLVKEISPTLFVMENVPGLLGKRGHELAIAFEERMQKAGYLVEAVKINCADYGVPQNRKRIFYYGWPQGESRFVFPGKTHENEVVTVGDAIGDLPSPPQNHKPHPEDPLHRRMRLSQKNKERLKMVPQGGGFEDIPVEMRAPCHRDGPEDIGHRGVYGRLDANKPAGTITARFDSFTRGRFAHPFENRNISLREGARLQTFDDDFKPEGTQEEVAALIGNAVPPRIGEVIGEAIINYFRGGEKSVERNGIKPQRMAHQLGFFKS